MLGETLFDQPHLDLMKRAIGAYSVRHRVIADNITNVDVEGFSAQQVDFETALAKYSARHRSLPGLRTSPSHLSLGASRDPEHPVINPVADGFDNGINDVNVDREMGEMVKNHLAYRLATRLLSRKYQGIKTAITGEIR